MRSQPFNKLFKTTDCNLQRFQGIRIRDTDKSFSALTERIARNNRDPLLFQKPGCEFFRGHSELFDDVAAGYACGAVPKGETLYKPISAICGDYRC